jgi:hypothetical protein
MTILKQLIEQMIGDYLNESYEDDLVESIFEEVSEETWEAIEEAILNELSPKTYKNYINKAAARQADRQVDIDWDGDHRDTKEYRDTPEHERDGRTDIRKSSTGIKRAKRLLKRTK